ncbi:DUF3307 domain-containing protein [Jannaschia ovalis]|uniref:DUF3307 domain-containing protein n=1 Tax=Jannaschia ovalis TaxID=3038773 RepID=A0ABY8LA63_9RHOB|nr:DUF3307 domain-containing protein [Jannaschia sp. GRR-S6-38]WGH78237.1 DUF3307 domain-containing protein [Jannaschia sp. GRR-S6-38]
MTPLADPATLATLTALLLAHLLADHVFQTGWMVANKTRPHVFALHIAVVFALTALALGGAWEAAGLLAAAHAAIDLAKLALPDRLWSYLADQALHLATLVAAALLLPGTPALPLAWLPSALIATGFLLATLPAAPAIRLLMAPYGAGAPTGTLPGAGRLIGLLERSLILLLVIIGQPAGIGFLIAAKSVLRFEAASEARKAEYVIIGTLASFGWALAVAVALTRLTP